MLVITAYQVSLDMDKHMDLMLWCCRLDISRNGLFVCSTLVKVLLQLHLSL